MCGHDPGWSVWVLLPCRRFIHPGAERSGLTFQLPDITSRCLAEDRLHHIAFEDGLTDLANRNCFNERLHAAVERNRTEAENGFVVTFMDLDRFKPTARRRGAVQPGHAQTRGREAQARG